MNQYDDDIQSALSSLSHTLTAVMKYSVATPLLVREVEAELAQVIDI